MQGRERVVVFDLGNVLIVWDRRLLFSQLIPDPEELEYFLDNVYTLDANRLLDMGTPLPDVVRAVADAHPRYREAVLALEQRWTETLGGVIDGTVDILEELAAADVRLFALTNWGADTFGQIEHRYPFFERFEGMVVSGREGVTKPDSRIFHILCERHGFEPGQAVFIDDSPANVAAAAAEGFDSLLFERPERLREQLVERRLLSG